MQEVHEVSARQCTSTILMVRPASFGFNPETAANNAFQSNESSLTGEEIRDRALKEFDNFVQLLRKEDIQVLVVDDTIEPVKMDAVFPNNWISFHSNGSVITYPMQSAIRRQERREDIIQNIMTQFRFTRRYSLEHYEDEGLFLEGTGSMVLDRQAKIVYACISLRTDPTVLDKFCALTGYERILFRAQDELGNLIYHTNVMMCLGSGFAVVCLECITNEVERATLVNALKNTGKEIVEISMSQMCKFAGNMLQLSNFGGNPCIVMSSQAYQSLEPPQVDALSIHGKILHHSLDTIEYFGGGSARCMIAEIFTPVPGGDF